MIVEIQHYIPTTYEWINYKLSNIHKEKEALIIGGRSRILVNGVVIYPPEEKEEEND